jgi:hypothetical protein
LGDVPSQENSALTSIVFLQPDTNSTKNTMNNQILNSFYDVLTYIKQLVSEGKDGKQIVNFLNKRLLKLYKDATDLMTELLERHFIAECEWKFAASDPSCRTPSRDELRQFGDLPPTNAHLISFIRSRASEGLDATTISHATNIMFPNHGLSVAGIIELLASELYILIKDNHKASQMQMKNDSKDAPVKVPGNTDAPWL